MVRMHLWRGLIMVVFVLLVGTAMAAEEPIELWDAGERLLCAVQPTADGWSVQLPGGAVLGTLAVSDDRVKLADPDGVVVLKVKVKEYGAEIEDGQGVRRFKLKQDDEGHWKVRDADDETVLKCKRKSDGFEVRTADGTTVAKVKARGGGLRGTTEGGEPLFVVYGVDEPEVGMWWSVDRLELAERAAVVVFFLEVR